MSQNPVSGTSLSTSPWHARRLSLALWSFRVDNWGSGFKCPLFKKCEVIGLVQGEFWEVGETKYGTDFMFWTEERRVDRLESRMMRGETGRMMSVKSEGRKDLSRSGRKLNPGKEGRPTRKDWCDKSSYGSTGPWGQREWHSKKGIVRMEDCNTTHLDTGKGLRTQLKDWGPRSLTLD